MDQERDVMKGQIIYLNPQGWGFILGDDDGDVKKRYFHVSGCLSDFDTLQLGDKVAFIPALVPEGYRAIGVKVDSHEGEVDGG